MVRSPDWSPSGDRIAFGAGSARESIYTVGRDGSGLRQVTAGYDPAWAPDGSRIAFTLIGVWTVRADGSGRQRLTKAGWGEPAWRPLAR